MNKRVDILIGVFIALVFGIIGFSTVSDYGVTIDSPPHFIIGDFYLNAFRTGDFSEPSNISQFGGPHSITKDNLLWDYTYKAYGPLTNFIGGLVSRFGGSLDYVASYHLHLIIFAIILLLLVYFFVLKIYGRLTAVVSTISLALFPAFIGHAHNNMKDVPLVTFIALTIISFYYGLVGKNNKWLMASAIFLGVSISLKVTSLFIPLILLLWYLVINRRKIRYDGVSKILSLPLPLSLIAYPFVALVGFFIVNPYLWVSVTEIKRRLWNSLHFWAGNRITEVFYFGRNYVAYNLPWHYPWVMLFITTPPIIFALALVGIYVSIKNFSKDKASSLVLLWFFIPIAKFSIPGISVYNNIRLFLEAIPALCILSGVGAKYVWGLLKKKGRIAMLIFLALFYSTLLLSLVNLHPYEVTYHNFLSGGIKGAEKNFEIDYWSNSLKEGVEWVEKNLEENATLIVPITGSLVRYHLIREDINLITGSWGQRTPDSLIINNKTEYVMYPILQNLVNEPVNGTVVYYTENNLEPIHTVDVEGVTILKIFKA